MARKEGGLFIETPQFFPPPIKTTYRQYVVRGKGRGGRVFLFRPPPAECRPRVTLERQLLVGAGRRRQDVLAPPGGGGRASPRRGGSRGVCGGARRPVPLPGRVPPEFRGLCGHEWPARSGVLARRHTLEPVGRVAPQCSPVGPPPSWVTGPPAVGWLKKLSPPSTRPAPFSDGYPHHLSSVSVAPELGGEGPLPRYVNTHLRDGIPSTAAQFVRSWQTPGPPFVPAWPRPGVTAVPL